MLLEIIQIRGDHGSKKHHDDKGEHTDDGDKPRADIDVRLCGLSTQYQFHGPSLDLAGKQGGWDTNGIKHIQEQDEGLLIADCDQPGNISNFKDLAAHERFDKGREYVNVLKERFDTFIVMHNATDS